MLEAQKCSLISVFYLHFDMNEDIFPKIKIPVLKNTGLKVWV